MREFEFKKIVPIAVLCIMVAILAVAYGAWASQPVEQPVARSIGAPKVPYTACYYETGAIAVDKPYLLIDLSDATNWPHSATNEVIIRSAVIQGTVSGAHQWNLTVGVVVENDATNGTAIWVVNHHLIALTGMFTPPQRTYDAGGLNLRASGDTLTYAVANGHSELTSWQSDTAISATVGTTGTVAVGDVVILADEITDGSTLNFSVCVDYDTE